MNPQQFIELKALMGDTADNIPGVPKVGEKTATALMEQYGSIENIYAHLEEISKTASGHRLLKTESLQICLKSWRRSILMRRSAIRWQMPEPAISIRRRLMPI